jgi:hypothetical protein
MKTRRFAVSLTLAMFGCILACDHPATHDSTPDVRSPPSGVTNVQARGNGEMVDALASARCDREVGCKNVGAGQKYASRDVCLDQMRGSIGNDLNPQNCPLGLDRSHFDACLAAVRAEQCDRPLDTLARVQECRTSDMCLK